MKIPLDDSFIQGAVSLEQVNGGIRPWRMPLHELALFQCHDGLTDKLMDPAGVRIRFHTDSPFVELEIVREQGDTSARMFDLVDNGKRLQSVYPKEGASTIRFDGLPEDDSRILEIWPGFNGGINLKTLRVAEGSTLRPVQDQRLRWVTYGSSISQCGAAHSPSRTWPAMAALTHDLNLTCLGVSGQCHIDAMMGRVIRDLPADLITLKLGINVYGKGSLNTRSFAPAVIGMVRCIREKHPETPMGLITPIHACNRETERNSQALTLENLREELRKAYAALKAFGDPHLFLFEGTDLLGASEARLLPDNLHPNGEGYELIGRRVAEKILPVLLADRA